MSILKNKERISKVDIYKMFDDIYNNGYGHELIRKDKEYNPDGTLKYWDIEIEGRMYKGLTTREAFWLVFGMTTILNHKPKRGKEKEEEEIKEIDPNTFDDEKDLPNLDQNI